RDGTVPQLKQERVFEDPVSGDGVANLHKGLRSFTRTREEPARRVLRGFPGRDFDIGKLPETAIDTLPRTAPHPKTAGMANDNDDKMPRYGNRSSLRLRKGIHLVQCPRATEVRHGTRWTGRGHGCAEGRTQLHQCLIQARARTTSSGRMGRLDQLRRG